MQTTLGQTTGISISGIYAMRYAGASLQQIADRIGKTKEGVRQILLRNYGSTRHELLSTLKLCRLSGLSRVRIMELYSDGIIAPVTAWDTSVGHYFLWSPDTWTEIIRQYEVDKLCKVCHSIVPRGRWRYCSEQCYGEGRKYRYKSVEAKRRHLESVKRYRARRRVARRMTDLVVG